VPTAQISLIREHTEAIKPPRALWVPFELGRPLGVPNDVPFQTKVLLAALRLFEATSGPVLEDFPEDAPVSEDTDAVWACPLNLSAEKADLNSTEQLRKAFKREMTQLCSWYDLAVKKRGRTTVGVSGLNLDMIGHFISAFLEGGMPENPRQDLPIGLVLRLAVDDLKAYYFEAVSAQPGQALPGSNTFVGWFWGETVAGKVLHAVKQSCTKSDDTMLQAVGMRLLIPMTRTNHKASY
jgi:hypothetical protein